MNTVETGVLTTDVVQVEHVSLVHQAGGSGGVSCVRYREGAPGRPLTLATHLCCDTTGAAPIHRRQAAPLFTLTPLLPAIGGI